MILLIDDDRDLCASLKRYLVAKGFVVRAETDGREALAQVEKSVPALVLLDLDLNKGLDGMEVLQRIRAVDALIPIVIMTGHADVPSAIAAMKSGATDYMTKPFSNEELLVAVEKAMRTGSLVREVELLRGQLKHHGASPVLGTSRAMSRVMEHVRKVAPTDYTVVIEGESGTGKEVIARLLWELSPRKDRPFVTVDSGALPEALIESELFGYEKGAFSGADARRPGQFELASGGTLFLDEIGNLTLDAQAKLLRALQEKRIRRLGGKADIAADVRVIAATNKDLAAAVRTGAFREDLYHRLDQFRLYLPPLRERREDIPALTDAFLHEAGRRLGKTGLSLSADCREFVQRHHWPGNVRELRNAVLRGALLASGVLGVEHLNLTGDMSTAPAGAPAWQNLRLADRREKAQAEVEKAVILEALAKAGNNKARAARLLGIDRKSLYNKLHKYGLS